MGKTRKQIKLKNILFTLVAWAIVLFIINSLCGFVSKNTYVHVNAVNKKIADKTFGYFEPNQHKRILFPGLKPYIVTVDSNGFRSVGVDSGDYLEKEDVFKILCVGDSYTFGAFVDDEDSYPFRLQSFLQNHKKEAIVLNAGIGGGTASDYIYYLKEKGLALKPDIVIMNFCPNDIKGILSSKAPLYEKMIQENQFSLFKTIKLLKIMRMFRRFEVNYKYHRYLIKIKDPVIKKILVNESKELEDILRVAAFREGKKVTAPYDESLEKNWQAYLASLDESIELLRKENIRFIYFIYPNILTIYDRTDGLYQDILKDFLDERGVEYIDLTPVFREQRENYFALYNNPPRDFHLSGDSNQILAEEIYARLYAK